MASSADDDSFYIQLSKAPVRFEPVSKVTNVFFDDTNRQVSWWRCSGVARLSVSATNYNHIFSSSPDSSPCLQWMLKNLIDISCILILPFVQLLFCTLTSIGICCSLRRSSRSSCQRPGWENEHQFQVNIYIEDKNKHRPSSIGLSDIVHVLTFFILLCFLLLNTLCILVSRMEERGDVVSIKFAIGMKILAVQRSHKSVVSNNH